MCIFSIKQKLKKKLIKMKCTAKIKTTAIVAICSILMMICLVLVDIIFVRFVLIFLFLVASSE